MVRSWWWRSGLKGWFIATSDCSSGATTRLVSKSNTKYTLKLIRLLLSEPIRSSLHRDSYEGSRKFSSRTTVRLRAYIINFFWIDSISFILLAQCGCHTTLAYSRCDLMWAIWCGRNKWYENHLNRMLLVQI